MGEVRGAGAAAGGVVKPEPEKPAATNAARRQSELRATVQQALSHFAQKRSDWGLPQIPPVFSATSRKPIYWMIGTAQAMSS